MNIKHWIRESELKEYYDFGKHTETFEQYKRDFLKEMEKAGIPHKIIKG